MTIQEFAVREWMTGNLKATTPEIEALYSRAAKHQRAMDRLAHEALKLRLEWALDEYRVAEERRDHYLSKI